MAYTQPGNYCSYDPLGNLWSAIYIFSQQEYDYYYSPEDQHAGWEAFWPKLKEIIFPTPAGVATTVLVKGI